MSSRTIRSLLAVLALALVLLGSGVSANARASSAPQLPRFLWGAWIGDQYTGAQPPWDWRAVTDFERRNTGGRHINVLHWGVRNPWDHDFNYWRGALDIARNAGVISVIDMATDSVPLANIASGTRDPALETWANEAAAWGHPFFLRFDWEMNGNWFPWAEGVTKAPGEYVAAWRHVHDIFTAVGATNVHLGLVPQRRPHTAFRPRRALPGRRIRRLDRPRRLQLRQSVEEFWEDLLA